MCAFATIVLFWCHNSERIYMVCFLFLLKQWKRKMHIRTLKHKLTVVVVVVV